MKCYFDWNTQKEIKVVPGNYFENIALAGDTLCPDTAGRDEFLLAGVIPPAKRLAGSGRSNRYSFADILGAIEAAPSIGIILPNDLSEISFLINTDIILDPGLLAASLSLDIATVSGMTTRIPLNRSDVRIDWQSRGTFVVTVPIM
ncbi:MULTISPECIES: hypothetical protein [Sporomusa]|jgi:hypothetical protein|uniref:Uncharacterized protein n=1 Tax=Sporomusa silvacetica DSM 10669 TaxID=1123289 RepID=A0ABZ3IUX1_9FIRM|nr:MULTISPECIES: hypothetical protein [Sporomusa]OZC12987.1 hypothetical protein SPSIL_57060 [Sporomusa silvacetica DSM 10669]TWH46468.1 hypothetical protein Salpa_2459 [Sporomusa sp. KB1]